MGSSAKTQNDSKEKSDTVPEDYETATFAAGCFWGVEAAFRKVDGVESTVVGYTGGHMKNPTYKQVCSDTTGHAEAIQLTYDPKKITYQKLLDTFWSIHDPTTPNRQGPDIGSQYRSVVFYHDHNQKQTAENSMDALDKSDKFNRPIVTSIEPAQPFYRAEEYHQRYHEKHGLTSCQSNIK